MKVCKLFIRDSTIEPEFNTPFDKWLRSMKPDVSDSAQAKKKFRDEFHRRMQAEKEKRKNRPFYKKLVFWK